MQNIGFVRVLDDKYSEKKVLRTTQYLVYLKCKLTVKVIGATIAINIEERGLRAFEAFFYSSSPTVHKIVG